LCVGRSSFVNAATAPNSCQLDNNTQILVTFEIMENEEEDQELEGDVAAIITVFNAGEDVDEAIIEFRNIGPNENAFIHFFEAFKRRKIVGL